MQPPSPISRMNSVEHAASVPEPHRHAHRNGSRLGPFPAVRVAFVVGWLTVLFGHAAFGEELHTGNEPADGPRYTVREDHDPNGIGKFYMGREIAQVMGHQGIAWLERPEREREERLTLLIECLQVTPGMVVADIGAGSGVISAMLSDAVGPQGTVLAVDIQQEMLDALAAKCKQRGIENIEPVLGTTQSPRLKPESVDLAVMVDVYHEFDFPYEMLLEISRSLKPGGRVAFVEYRKEDPAVPIKEVHKMTEAQVKKEAGLPEFRLTWKETLDKLPRQHVIIFEKRPGDAEDQGGT